MKRTLLILFVFSCTFVVLSVGRYTRESATYDEPKHLASGYAALKLHEFRLDLDSPPLVCMWAALPLMFTPGATIETNSIHWLKGDNTEFHREFLYQQNNADRIIYRARFMIVLLGILLGAMLFTWARALFGLRPAVCVLALYTLEPNLLAHSNLVTTDLGFTCFFFGSVYFLWRVTRNFTPGNQLGAAACFVAAMLTKFSALILIPITIVLLTIYAVQTRKFGRALIILFMLIAGSYVAVHGTYAALGAADARQLLLPDSYIIGLREQLALQANWPVFLAGNYSTHGWWYYYPVTFLVKTPVAVLLLFVSGLAFYSVERRTLSLNEIFVLLPPGVFLGVAMLYGFNLGLRFILPVYPFVLLVAGKACARLLRDSRSWLMIIAAALLLTEFAWVYPHNLAFFNFLAGGPRGGSRILVDSNLDWGQDLKTLKRWMDDHCVKHINLSYFGTADPEYYGIACTRLPGHPNTEPYAAPALPGYVAISVTNLRGVYFSGRGRRFYEPLARLEPVATVGYSIYIYYVECPWW